MGICLRAFNASRALWRRFCRKRNACATTSLASQGWQSLNSRNPSRPASVSRTLAYQATCCLASHLHSTLLALERGSQKTRFRSQSVTSRGIFAERNRAKNIASRNSTRVKLPFALTTGSPGRSAEPKIKQEYDMKLAWKRLSIDQSKFKQGAKSRSIEVPRSSAASNCNEQHFQNWRRHG